PPRTWVCDDWRGRTWRPPCLRLPQAQRLSCRGRESRYNSRRTVPPLPSGTPGSPRATEIVADLARILKRTDSEPDPPASQPKQNGTHEVPCARHRRGQHQSLRRPEVCLGHFLSALENAR